jgi:hypothetical protein
MRLAQSAVAGLEVWCVSASAVRRPPPTSNSYLLFAPSLLWLRGNVLCRRVQCMPIVPHYSLLHCHRVGLQYYLPSTHRGLSKSWSRYSAVRTSVWRRGTRRRLPSLVLPRA